jgi:hypothetical protein
MLPVHRFAVQSPAAWTIPVNRGSGDATPAAIGATSLVPVVPLTAVTVAAPATPADVASEGSADGSGTSPLVTSVLMLAGVLLISMAIVRGVRRGIERRRQDDATPRERLDSIKTAAAARERAATGEPEGVLGPVQAATELAAMLDTRAARLEALLEDADERIRSLAGSLREAATGSPAGEAAADPGAARRRMAARVHELSAAGMTPVAIARAVEAPLGEVELVLALGPLAAASDPATNEGTSPRD